MKRLTFALALLLAPSTAMADCTGPAGVAGTILYNADYATMQFCNGTSWVSMAAGGTAGATFSLGSASAPGFAPIGDSNTGLFSPSADALALATAGSERFRIDSSGNVGIGTTSPGQKLTVAGTIESTSGGIKFPDGTTQTTAVSAGIPSGAVMAFNLATCPSGWTEYTPARGRFVRGIDSTGTNDPDGVRALGSTQADAFQGHKHAWSSGGAQDYGLGDSIGFSSGYNLGSNTGSWVGTPTTDGTSGTPRTAAETRPKNVALLYCQKS